MGRHGAGRCLVHVDAKAPPRARHGTDSIGRESEHPRVGEAVGEDCEGRHCCEEQLSYMTCGAGCPATEEATPTTAQMEERARHTESETGSCDNEEYEDAHHICPNNWDFEGHGDVFMYPMLLRVQ